ncbi:BRO1-like domain-containing protein [Phycomyces nitens]|nr:BRO1-like domain-containing protein [Phycomyces nitens]
MSKPPQPQSAADMPALLAIPRRSTFPIEWTPALVKYINTAYDEDGSLYSADAQELDNLRQQALVAPCLETLFTYYSQLTFVCSRFPLDIGLDFAWLTAFQPTQPPVVHPNLFFEKSCILFSIGAVYSQLGCTEQRLSSDSIRKACSYFQQAAGCFKYIQREIVPDMRVVPMCDVSPEVLGTLIHLMLAQAQECVWQKAMMEHLKHGTIARLAIKVADFYESVLKDIPSCIPEEWQTYTRIKASYFVAVAQYHKANECISQGRYGEEIGRLRVAEKANRCALDLIVSSFQLAQNGVMHAGVFNEVRQLEEVIEHDLIRAEKDNDIVYVETVPEEAQLSPILRSDMVKPVIPPDLLEPAYWKRHPEVEIRRPLFQALVPFAVHQAASMYKDKKELVVSEITSQCAKLNEESTQLMEEFNLPFATDVMDVTILPINLMACAEEVQHEGGIQSLKDMLEKIQELSKKNVDFIEEGFNVLEDENEQDEILQRQYGTIWARPTSKSLTGSLLSQGSRFHDTIQAAQKADRIVRAKVTNWGKAIELLSRPVSDIKANLPFTKDDAHYPQLEALVSQLREVMQKIQTIKDDYTRIHKEAESLSGSDDISEPLLTKADALTGGSPIIKMEPEQFGDVFEDQIAKYAPLTTQLQSYVKEHAEELASLRDLYEQFALVAQGSNLAVKREKTVKNLEQAFLKFKEIRTNLVEGIKFYSQYTDTLSKFRDSCIDYALARRMEASELARDAPKRR